MELFALGATLVIFMALGVPVAFALLASSIATFFLLDIPLLVVFQRMAAGVSIFSLMAIPFFIFAGELMYRSGIAQRLVELAEAMFGRVQGGLGLVNVGASTMFGAVSGSAIASASAMGSTMIPLMKERGYDADYNINVTVTAAIVGLLIPPSHNMIIYAAASGIGVSIGDLFLAGIIPGMLTSFLLMFVAWRVAVSRGYAKGSFPGWSFFLRSLMFAIPGLISAFIIMGGILSGVFTATESSAIAVIYTIFIGVFAYRSLGWSQFIQATSQAVRTTAMVLLIIGAASAFGFALAILEAPSALAEALAAATQNPIIILLLINIMLLFLGSFMDMSPLIVITTPILLPVAMQFGVDPVHFGIIMMLNLGIGLVTPPIGSVLFVGAAVGGIRIEQTIKTIWPFYLALLAALLLVTFFPALSLTIPHYF